jgi:hypothetical protein
MFEQLSQFEIQYICRILLNDGQYLSLSNLVCCSKRFRDVGQVMLRDWHQRLEDEPPTHVYEDGDKYWKKNGKLQRDGDLPAVIWANGRQEWWINGELHREGDQPAVIKADGTQEWWVHGHRVK